MNKDGNHTASHAFNIMKWIIPVLLMGSWHTWMAQLITYHDPSGLYLLSTLSPSLKRQSNYHNIPSVQTGGYFCVGETYCNREAQFNSAEGKRAGERYGYSHKLLQLMEIKRIIVFPFLLEAQCLALYHKHNFTGYDGRRNFWYIIFFLLLLYTKNCFEI